jgi:hypothetical protein
MFFHPVRPNIAYYLTTHFTFDFMILTPARSSFTPVAPWVLFLQMRHYTAVAKMSMTQRTFVTTSSRPRVRRLLVRLVFSILFFFIHWLD